MLPLVNSPTDIESYVCKDNEIKFLYPVYDTENGKFLGVEKRLAAISVRSDEEELFLSYGYNKEKSKVLLLSQKVRLPNIFVSTAFKKHKDFLKSDDKGESSTLFFYLPSTTDRKESINQFKSNVQLHPIDALMKSLVSFLASKVLSFHIT